MNYLSLTNEIVPKISSIAVLHDQEDVRTSLHIVIQLYYVHIPQILRERDKKERERERREEREREREREKERERESVRAYER